MRKRSKHQPQFQLGWGTHSLSLDGPYRNIRKLITKKKTGIFMLILILASISLYNHIQLLKVLDKNHISLDEDRIWIDRSNYERMKTEIDAFLLKEKSHSRNYKSVFEDPNVYNHTNYVHRKCDLDLALYVYDDLEPEYTTDIHNRIREIIKQGEPLQENVATEWALVQLFQSNPCRTMHPEKADLYIVPYMHHSDCHFTDGYEHACGQLNTSKMFHLFQSLEFYDTNSQYQHLFLQAYDDSMSNKIFKKRTPLKLVSNRDEKESNGHIIVPIFHEDPKYQPGVLLHHNASWWTRQRTYSFVIIAGIELNENMLKKRRQGRVFRRLFFRLMKDKFPNRTFAGKPFIMEEEVTSDPSFIYQDSILCPVLPGDNCWQRRFFDVIRNGCIPVVLEWTFEDDNGEPKKSWHTPFDPIPIELTYPFADDSVPYSSFVVTVPYNKTNVRNVTSIIHTMKSILNDPYDLKQRQERMMYYAPYLTFGLGLEAHAYKDGFYQIMKELEKYTKQMKKPMSQSSKGENKNSNPYCLISRNDIDAFFPFILSLEHNFWRNILTIIREKGLLRLFL